MSDDKRETRVIDLEEQIQRKYIDRSKQEKAKGANTKTYDINKKKTKEFSIEEHRITAEANSRTHYVASMSPETIMGIFLFLGIALLGVLTSVFAVLALNVDIPIIVALVIGNTILLISSMKINIYYSLILVVVQLIGGQIGHNLPAVICAVVFYAICWLAVKMLYFHEHFSDLKNDCK